MLPGIFEPLEARLADRMFALRAQFETLAPRYDDTVVRVDIDDRSLQSMGTYYLGREEYARLVENLSRAGVAAQLHDVIFASPQSAAADQALIFATERAENAYYGMALGLALGTDVEAEDDLGRDALALLDRVRLPRPHHEDLDGFYRATRHFLTYPSLANAARGIGFLDITVDRDGVYRRVPLLARDGDALLPSLPFRVACDLLGVGLDQIEIRPGRSITLRGARPPGAEQPRDIKIPIDAHGRMIVDFVGPWGAMTHYPFAVIYEASDDRFMMEDLREELAGRVAVVSWVSTGAGDIAAVPVDPTYPLSGIQANVVHSILTEQFLRQAPTWFMMLCVEVPLLVLLFVGSRRLSTLPFVFLPPLLVALHVVGALAAFLFGRVIMGIAGPMIILAVSTLVIAAWRYHSESQARAVLRHTFDAFFPPAVVDKVMMQAGEMAANAQKKELTILFSDIRGFTEHSSSLEPGHVRELLNEYFERMIEIVFRHEGTLDKFIGDGLMVFFGDPQPQSDHALRCVRAALEMQRAARDIDNAWRRRGDMPLAIRIGINTGEVIVGNMGSSKRLSYTVLGEAVNLAQRLESAAPTGGILISARTRELAGDQIVTRRIEPVRVKGFAEPIDVYDVPLDQDTGARVEPELLRRGNE
ncbi:MAG: adenylate/guanylate cyclase domain-containing protein [Acidobacteriota bacterium]|nr:MAG: adenylate/guanylate cyclase domain-containing protein [Acidobacteriota bacterium]